MTATSASRRVVIVGGGFAGLFAARPRSPGSGRVTGAVPDVAAALGYDVEAALLSPDDD